MTGVHKYMPLVTNAGHLLTSISDISLAFKTNINIMYYIMVIYIYIYLFNLNQYLINMIRSSEYEIKSEIY